MLLIKNIKLPSFTFSRYDGRGALYDLKQYEAMSGGHDANRWVGLSDSERYVEQLCDEERYRALQHNEEEEALYQGNILMFTSIPNFDIFGDLKKL